MCGGVADLSERERIARRYASQGAVSAGAARIIGGFGPDFDHLTLRVDLDQPWLTDVGFGVSFRNPLRLDLADVQSQPDGSYQIVADGPERILVRGEGQDAKPQYRFGLAPRALADEGAVTAALWAHFEIRVDHDLSEAPGQPLRRSRGSSASRKASPR